MDKKFMGFFLVVVLLITSLAYAGKSRGELVYNGFCVVCHGATGKGDGYSSNALLPPPPDFSSKEYWVKVDPESLRRIIAEGEPDRQMQGFTDELSSEDIDAVLGYLFSFR